MLKDWLPKSNLKKILGLVDPTEHRKLLLIILAMVLIGLLEITSISSIAVFLSIVGKPTLIYDNNVLHTVYAYLGFTSSKSFMILIGGAVLSLLLLGNLAAALLFWGLMRFSFWQGHLLSLKLFKNYIYQPYEYFLNKNSNNLTKNVLVGVQRSINNVLLPFLQICARTIVTSFIVLLLVIANPKLAMATALILGLLYTFVYKILKSTLISKGQQTFSAMGGINKVLNESFQGIKEIKVYGCEHFSAHKLDNYSQRYAKSEAINQVIPQVTRYAIEGVAFGSVIFLILHLLKSYNGIEQILPILALYVFSGYRLLPALQQIFQSLSSIKSNQAAVDEVYQDLHIGNEKTVKQQLKFCAITFAQQIELKAISYRYPNSTRYALDNINLTFPKNSIVGLIGATGSGKTTLVEVFLGLLANTQGEVIIDGKPQDIKNSVSWKKMIGYVPQQVNLVDDTVINNIAFGVEPQHQDLQKIINAAKIANIHEFITTELPNAYETILGDRGIRLSGGQRQRLGIARALYTEPEILILDEATSALDNLTERAVMQSIANLLGKKTIIIIAHRLSTVKICDQIYVLDKGSIKEQGSYAALSKNNILFQA
jgi:ABC-type multidrug transport system fused ATPase/permease subunit